MGEITKVTGAVHETRVVEVKRAVAEAAAGNGHETPPLGVVSRIMGVKNLHAYLEAGGFDGQEELNRSWRLAGYERPTGNPHGPPIKDGEHKGRLKRVMHAVSRVAQRNGGRSPYVQEVAEELGMNSSGGLVHKFLGTGDREATEELDRAWRLAGYDRRSFGGNTTGRVSPEEHRRRIEELSQQVGKLHEETGQNPTVTELARSMGRDKKFPYQYLKTGGHDAPEALDEVWRTAGLERARLWAGKSPSPDAPPSPTKESREDPKPKHAAEATKRIVSVDGPEKEVYRRELWDEVARWAPHTRGCAVILPASGGEEIDHALRAGFSASDVLCVEQDPDVRMGWQEQMPDVVLHRRRLSEMGAIVRRERGAAAVVNMDLCNNLSAAALEEVRGVAQSMPLAPLALVAFTLSKGREDPATVATLKLVDAEEGPCPRIRVLAAEFSRTAGRALTCIRHGQYKGRRQPVVWGLYATADGNGLAQMARQASILTQQAPSVNETPDPDPPPVREVGWFRRLWR